MLRTRILSFFLWGLLVLSNTCAYSSDFIRIGTNVWPGYEPFYLARELGFYESDAIKLVEYPSASEVLRAFRNQSIEAAALTLDEVLSLNQAGIPVSVILILDISNGGDTIISQPEVKSFEELKGKNIAVETGALGAYMISRALEINQFSLSDVNIKHIDVDGHEEAYNTRKVDAVVTFEPVRTKLLAKGGHELFTSKQIPNEIIDV